MRNEKKGHTIHTNSWHVILLDDAVIALYLSLSRSLNSRFLSLSQFTIPILPLQMYVYKLVPLFHIHTVDDFRFFFFSFSLSLSFAFFFSVHTLFSLLFNHSFAFIPFCRGLLLLFNPKLFVSSVHIILTGGVSTSEVIDHRYDCISYLFSKFYIAFLHLLWLWFLLLLLLMVVAIGACMS